MRSLAVEFRQPAFCDFPCFIQYSEQIKIQDFCPVCPVKTFDMRVLYRLAQLNKFQHHSVLFAPLGQRQRDKFWSVRRFRDKSYCIGLILSVSLNLKNALSKSLLR